MVNTSMRIVDLEVQQTGRGVDRDLARAMVDHEPQRDQGASVKHQQVAGRVGLDGLDGAENRAARVDDLGSDQLVDPEAVRIFNGIGEQNDASEILGAAPVDHAPEGHDPTPRTGGLEPAGALDLQGPDRSDKHGSWCDPLGSIRDQFDDDLAPDPMGLDDATDLEHVA
jgi:hypothetical protein